MAHELDTTTGRAAFAHVGERAWHGLGQLLTLDADLDTWAREAGLSYRIQRANVQYATDRSGVAKKVFDDRVVLFRDDTHAPLAVVSDGYKVVQPREVLQFFDRWAKEGGLRLESAGALFDGKRYFACAKLAEGVEIGKGDVVKPYIVCSTSADGSLASTVRWTSVRVVCNNTLRASFGDAAQFKQSHRSKFKADSAQLAVEEANEQFAAFCKSARELTRISVNALRAQDLTARLFEIDLDSDKEQKIPAGYEKILALFNGTAKGSNLPGVKGTGWGWINAVTEYVDHDVRARSDEHRFVSAQDGPGAALKARAVDLITA